MGSAALCLAEDKLATTFQTPFNGLPVHTIPGQRANAGFGDRVLHRMFTVREDLNIKKRFLSGIA